ncbi:MAG TPA: M28 family peptidase [Terriglobales bacterium]|nr:M28 family peptidase [Terriglobales bacterium]
MSRLPLLLPLTLLLACGGSQPSAKAPSESPRAAAPAASETAAAAAPVAPALKVDANRALEYTREVVALGPRPIGSAAHGKLEAYLRAHLKSDDLEEDAFTAQTAAGAFPMRNLIAKFPGSKDGIIVIAGHYDTCLTVPNFVGANDGGSSTGLPLALADALRGKKREGYSVWIVFLDGEEATRQWSDTDSTYGSRHLAEKWAKDGTAKKIKAFLLLDMVGDADLNIERDQNSTSWLEDLVYEAASRLGYQSHFYARTTTMEDDHLPMARAGIPVADLIDFDYGYGNVFWHTRQDTMDKLSARSLGIVGDVVLESVALLDAR